MDSKSVEYTLDKVASEALTEILAEIEAGKNESLEQLRSINRSTKAEVAKILEGSEREAESIRRQILGSAELEARNSILRSLEEASNKIVQDSLSTVAVKTPDDYERALAKLISEGALVIGRDAIVLCNTKDKKVVGSIVRELNRKNDTKLTVSEKSIGAMGGIVLESKDGTIRYDNTLEARLDRIKPQLRREIVNILSGESKTPEK